MRSGMRMWQHYGTNAGESKLCELCQREKGVTGHGILESGFVWLGDTDRKVGPHTPGHSSDHHRVHHKHRIDQCSGGW